MRPRHLLFLFPILLTALPLLPGDELDLSQDPTLFTSSSRVNLPTHLILPLFATILLPQTVLLPQFSLPVIFFVRSMLVSQVVPSLTDVFFVSLDNFRNCLSTQQHGQRFPQISLCLSPATRRASQVSFGITHTIADRATRLPRYVNTRIKTLTGLDLSQFLSQNLPSKSQLLIHAKSAPTAIRQAIPSMRQHVVNLRNSLPSHHQLYSQAQSLLHQVTALTKRLPSTEALTARTRYITDRAATALNENIPTKQQFAESSRQFRNQISKKAFAAKEKLPSQKFLVARARTLARQAKAAVEEKIPSKREIVNRVSWLRQNAAAVGEQLPTKEELQRRARQLGEEARAMTDQLSQGEIVARARKMAKQAAKNAAAVGEQLPTKEELQRRARQLGEEARAMKDQLSQGEIAARARKMAKQAAKNAAAARDKLPTKEELEKRGRQVLKDAASLTEQLPSKEKLAAGLWGFAARARRMAEEAAAAVSDKLPEEDGD